MTVKTQPEEWWHARYEKKRQLSIVLERIRALQRERIRIERELRDELRNTNECTPPTSQADRELVSRHRVV